MFSARNGSVLWAGRRISSFTARRVKREISNIGLDMDANSSAFEVLAEIQDQLIVACFAADKQARVNL